MSSKTIRPPPVRREAGQGGRSKRALLLLLPLLTVAGCDDLRRVDAAMRRMDWLDRVLDPQWAPPAPPPAPVVAETPPEPAAIALPEPAREPEPAPETEPVRQPATPGEGMRATLRQHPWLTRFWSELTPAQRARVEARLRGDAVADPAATWDPMGLRDRVRLIFGRPAGAGGASAPAQ